MTLQPLHILGMTSREFADAAAAFGVKPHAAVEAYRAVFRAGWADAPWISLPDYPITGSRIEHGTTKFLQCHPDGLETESVILPITSAAGRRRTTLCVSSQIGCAMGCVFCQTAQMGLLKNLSAEQIVAQWHATRFVFGSEISNVVFMGMGEPMDNIDAVIQAIRVLADRDGPAIAPARISVSTVGRVQGIHRLAGLVAQPGFHKLRLAVSINAPNDEIRSRIMPINRSTPMAKLMEAMRAWPGGAARRILIEYVLIPGVNDAPEHAEELCEYLRPLHCTVNVIPYNPRENSPWPAPEEQTVRTFIQWVHEHGQFVKRRQTLGRTVMAACGQLGNASARRRRAHSTI